MKDCIINPATGRKIKTKSQVAKKLIKSKMTNIEYVDCPDKKAKKPKREKTDENKYILNPKTGRMVLRSGILGKQLAGMNVKDEPELPVVKNVFIPLPSTSSSSSSSGSVKVGISFSKRKPKSAGATPSSSSGYSYSASSSSSGPAKRGRKKMVKSYGNTPVSSSSGSGSYETLTRGDKVMMVNKKNPHKGLWNKLFDK